MITPIDRSLIELTIEYIKAVFANLDTASRVEDPEDKLNLTPRLELLLLKRQQMAMIPQMIDANFSSPLQAINTVLDTIVNNPEVKIDSTIGSISERRDFHLNEAGLKLLAESGALEPKEPTVEATIPEEKTKTKKEKKSSVKADGTINFN